MVNVVSRVARGHADGAASARDVERVLDAFKWNHYCLTKSLEIMGEERFMDTYCSGKSCSSSTAFSGIGADEFSKACVSAGAGLYCQPSCLPLVCNTPFSFFEEALWP